jgi:tetratricopeptide (TPR) repeat protein
MTPARAALLPALALCLTSPLPAHAAAAGAASPADGYLVVPFENVSPVKQLDWMGPALATTIAEKLEAHPALHPAYPASILDGMAAKFDEARVAIRARDAGARFVFAGAFGRPNWKAEVRLRVYQVEGGPQPALRKLGESDQIGERDELLKLLDDALLEVLKQAGLTVEGDALAALSRRPTKDLYALTLYGRAENQFYGFGAPADLAGAEKNLQKVLKIDPKFAEAHRFYGVLLLARGERGKAAGQYAYALDLRPGYYAALVGLAQLYRAENRRQPALELAKQALDARPVDVEMRFLVGELEWESGDLEHALADLLQVTVAQPRHLPARRTLAQVRAARGEIEELTEELGRVADLAPEDVDVKFDLASSLMRLGRNDKAVVVYEEIVKRQPRNVQALKFTGDLYRRLGEPDKAILAYERVRKIAPDDPRPCFLLAGAYMDAGNDGKAEQVLLGAAEFHPRHIGEAWTDLGALALKRGDLTTATWYLSRAVERSPTRPKAHYNYALLLNALKQRDRALSELKSASELDPEDPECHYLAGVIYLRLGRLAEARLEFAEALKRRPTHADAKFNLALLEDLERRYGSEHAGSGSQ